MADAGGPKRPGALPVIAIDTGSANSSLNSSRAPSASGSGNGDHHPVQHSLASLSRNTSVISSSSSSSSTSSLVAPVRPPRPLRAWSQSPSPPGGGAGRRARSPHSPTTPRQPHAPPSYLAHQLGFGTASASLSHSGSANSNISNLANGTSASPSAPSTTGAGVLLPPLSPTSPIGAGYILPPPTTALNPTAPGSLDPNRAATISSSLANNQARPQMQPRTRTSSAVKKLYSVKDFEFGEPLGEGSYSTVLSATFRRSGKVYALKILDKVHLQRFNKVKYAYVEKDSLAKISTVGHPGFVRLHWAFSDASSLYFVLDLVPNGELVSKINKLGSLSLECSRYYAAQIIDAIIWMHGLGILHRDMKPENVLLDENWRVKITDFGTAKILPTPDSDERATSFVGSPGYISPELLTSSGCGKSADYWAIGCIIFHMLAGVQPFKALTPYLSMERTKKASYNLPPGLDPQATDLISQLLIVDPAQRMGDDRRGKGGSQEVLEHPWFVEGGIVWSEIWTRDAPPLEPGLVRKEENTKGGKRRRSRSKSKLRERTISTGGRRSGERATTTNGGDLSTSPSVANVRNLNGVVHDQLVEDDAGEHAALAEASSSSSPSHPHPSASSQPAPSTTSRDEEDDDDDEDDTSSDSDAAFDYLDDSISESDSDAVMYTGPRPPAVLVDSEDEMDDEREHHERRHRNGRRTPSLVSSHNDNVDGEGGEDTDDGTVGARSTRSRSSEESEASRGRSHVPSGISPLVTPSLETPASQLGEPRPSAPGGAAGDVIAWDAHYGVERPGTVLPFGDGNAEIEGVAGHGVTESSAIILGRGASPSSSNGTSSSGGSDAHGAWTHLLNPGERVLFCSPAQIRHRGGMFRARDKLKPRFLILTDQSRLLCVKTSSTHPSHAPAPAPPTHPYAQGHTRRPSTADKDREDARIARIKIEVLLVPPTPSTNGGTGGSSVSPSKKGLPSSQSGGGTKGRRGSSVGQGNNANAGPSGGGGGGGISMRRLSVSSAASRISIRARGRSSHRRGAEVLTGADTRREKEGEVVVVQTDSAWYTYVLNEQGLAARWKREILAAQQQARARRSDPS